MSSQVSPNAEGQGNGVESNRGLFLLSIDGGGIRGLSSLIILREVLYRMKSRGNLDDIPRPCDLFDLAGGTGTGGLIVLMLFRLKMTIDQAFETYVQFTRDVFKKPSWFGEAFSAKDFESAIVAIIRKYENFSNPLEVRLLDSDLEGHGKAFLCAYDERNLASPVLFRTYTPRKNPSYNCTIVEGARATCATQKIFKSIDIGPDYFRSTYIGGEWRSNNPTQFVLSEARDLFPSRPITCLLSIGTGRIKSLSFGPSFKLSQVLRDITQDCETTHQRIAQQSNLGLDVYFRLNVEQGLQASWMDCKNLLDVQAHSKSYLMEAEISQRVDSLVEKLSMSKVLPKNASDQDTVHGLLMPPTNADIYRSRLLVEKRGLPLWIPGPDMSLPIEYRRTGITIGDVGAFSPTGDFDFLFNIFCSADHPVNEGRVPADFSPLHIPGLKFKEHVFFDRSSYLSSSFLCKESDRSPNSFVFETSEKEAAVLVMPDGALSQDLRFHRKTIAKYILANAGMWYAYADGDQCGLEIRNGDLRLVYGIDKTTSWAIATLKTAVAEQLSTQLEFVAVGQPGASETYRWGSVGRARGRVGPPQDEMRDIVQATGEDSLQNQCLFVRTFNFNLSGQLWDELGISPLLSSNVKKDASDLQLPPTHHPLGRSPAPTQSTSDQYQGSGANFMNLEQSIQHPSMLLNKRLLEMHPDAAMVITEDADWISVIADTDITFPSPEVICSRVLASHDCWEEEGVVTLRAITKEDNSRDVATFIDTESQISISSQSSISTEEEIHRVSIQDLSLPSRKEHPPSFGPTPSDAVVPTHPSSVHHSLSTSLTSGFQAPSSAFYFTDIDEISIDDAYGGSFVIGNQENIREKFATYIVPEAFHDAVASSEFPECYPGTRKAIMRDLIHWFEQDCQTYPIYHLYAPVGSGKTVIAKTLADHFSNYDDPPKNSLLATFFFSRTAESRSNARAFIATIAYQVAKNLPPVATHIMEATTSDPAIFDKDIFIQMRTLLIYPLRKACAFELECGRATSHWPRLIVIDGLDECHNTETQINILKVITELARYRPFPLAVFLSCRHELHIRSAFTDPHLSGLALKTDLSNTRYDSESDIRRFLESKFREIRNSHYVTTGINLPSDWPGPEVIDMLVRKSSGHFIYPSVVVKYVETLDFNPTDRLKVVLGLPESSTVSPTPEERPFRQMDALYSQILASIKPKYLRTVRDAFSFALVPYGGSMLLGEPKTRARLANLEGILISVSSHRRQGRMAEIAVAFLHSSFSDFLRDPARSGQFYIDLKEAHADIAVYLLRKYIENNTGKESSARAIYSLIGHLRVAAPTEALRDRLLHMSVTTFRKIFKNCNRPDDLGLSFDVWKVLQSLGRCLGQLAFEESPLMETNLLRMMKGHLHKELNKYTKGPLNQLIALLMCGARLPQDFLGQRSPSESSIKEALVSLIWQKFDFHSDVRTTDESSLNLLVLLKVDQACLRTLIAEIGYTVDPSIYTNACIKALECLAEISGGNPRDSPLLGRGSGRNVKLSSEFSSFRQAAEMAQQDQEEDWWWLDSVPLASLFTHFFTDFVVRLLEHTTPSSEIADYLDDLEGDITLLCRCAKRTNMHGLRGGKKAKAVVRSHQTRANYPPSPYSSHVVLPDVGPTLRRKRTV